MNYLIDLILIAVIAFVVFMGSKKGFAVTLTDFISSIAAVILAKIASPYAASALYGGFIKQIVVDFLTEKYNSAQNALSDTLSSIASVFDFLPEGIRSFADASGYFNSDALSESVLSGITSVSELEAKIAAPTVTAILNIICFGILSVVFVIVLRIIGRLIAKLITSLKVTDKLDKILGAVLGLAKGILYAFVAAAVINVISFASESLAMYAANSYICSVVASIIGI